MRKTLAFACLFLSCAASVATVAEAAGSKRTAGAVSARASQAASVQAAAEPARARIVRLALDARLRTFLRLRGLPILPPNGTQQIIDNPDPIGQGPTPEGGTGLVGDTPDGVPDDTGRPDDGRPPGTGGGSGGSDEEEGDEGN